MKNLDYLDWAVVGQPDNPVSGDTEGIARMAWKYKCLSRDFSEMASAAPYRRTVLDVVFRRTHLGRDSVHIPCHHGCHLRNLTWPVKLTGAHAQRTISKRALV